MMPLIRPKWKIYPRSTQQQLCWWRARQNLQLFSMVTVAKMRMLQLVGAWLRWTDDTSIIYDTYLDTTDMYFKRILTLLCWTYWCIKSRRWTY